MYAILSLERPRLSIPAPRHPFTSRFRPQPETAMLPPVRIEEPDVLRIHISAYDEHTVVYFIGELDGLMTYDVTYDTLTGLLDSAVPRLILDLGGVSFADARGLSPLLQTVGAAARRGGWVRLARVPARVLRILDILRHTEKLPIYSTVAVAADTAPPGCNG